MEERGGRYSLDWLAIAAGILLPMISIVVGLAYAILSEGEGKRHTGRVLAKWGLVGLFIWTILMVVLGVLSPVH
jgi:drug/metabolite transporter superfamily protein YnfA